MMTFDEKTRDDIIALASEVREEKDQEVKILDSVIHNARYGNLGKLRNYIISFANKSERNFLNGKRLALLIREGKASEIGEFDALGTTDDFPCSLEYDGCVYEFYLPPTPSVRVGQFNKDVGRYTGLLIKNLIKKHVERYGEIAKTASPVVVFEYGIDRADPFARLYDADNRDSKKALDALTGTFFEDDNVLSVTTVSTGEYADHAYTKIYVMDKAIFSEWMTKKDS